jgi:hypothetical protein
MNPQPSLHHAHSVPEPVSFAKRPSSVQVEPTAPVSSRTKAFQPAEAAAEEAPVAMRLQRSATIGSRPKTVLELLARLHGLTPCRSSLVGRSLDAVSVAKWFVLFVSAFGRLKPW